MKPERQEKLQAWVDGELSETEAREFAALAATDPAARDLGNNLIALSRLLRENEPSRAVPESRDFYWSKIRRGIELGERTAASREASSPPASAAPARWLAWLVPLGAATMAAMFLLNPAPPVGSDTPDAAMTQHEIEAPSSEITTLTFYSAQDTTTVVWLGQLDFF